MKYIDRTSHCVSICNGGAISNCWLAQNLLMAMENRWFIPLFLNFHTATFLEQRAISTSDWDPWRSVNLCLQEDSCCTLRCISSKYLHDRHFLTLSLPSWFPDGTFFLDRSSFSHCLGRSSTVANYLRSNHKAMGFLRELRTILKASLDVLSTHQTSRRMMISFLRLHELQVLRWSCSPQLHRLSAYSSNASARPENQSYGL